MTKQLSVDHDSLVVFQFLSGVVELIAREKISVYSTATTSSSIPNSPSVDALQENSSSDTGNQGAANGVEWVRNVVWKYMKLAANLDVDALERFVRQSPALVSMEDAMQICQT